MRRCIAMTSVIVGLWACPGCEDRSQPEVEEEDPAVQRAADENGPAEPEVPPPPPPEPADLDAMDPKELEAACFAGDHEACDRLGH